MSPQIHCFVERKHLENTGILGQKNSPVTESTQNKLLSLKLIFKEINHHQMVPVHMCYQANEEQTAHQSCYQSSHGSEMKLF